DGDDVVSFARIFGERVQDVLARTFGRIAHGALYLQAAVVRLRAVLNRNRAEPDEPRARQLRQPVIGSSLRGLLGWIADWGGSQPRVEPLLVPGDGPSLDWPSGGDADDDEPDEPQAARTPTRVTAGKPVK